MDGTGETSKGVVAVWLGASKVYFDRRIARILLLGIISGFPWVLIGSSLSLWLKEDGLSRSTIGWAGLIYGVYAINFLWAPLIDRLRVPWLTGKLGHRRAWIVTLQFLILICLVGWSMVDPKANLFGVIAIGLVIAIASATQDITIDALRIEQIGESEGHSMAAGAAIAVVGWWTGFKLGGVVALRTAESLQQAGVQDYWQATFLILGSIIVLCNVALMFVPEPQPAARAAAQAEADQIIAARLGSPGLATRTIAWITGTVVGPLMSFFRRNGFAIALAVLGFIFLFKIGEAFLGRMSIIFYKELGFSKSDIALYSKGVGWFTTVIFTLLGGLIAIRVGLVRAMFLAGIFMALTNLMFSALAWFGKSELLFASAVLLDDLTGAFATVTFVAFISMLVDRTYTATQYALLASIGTAGRTLFAASSGALVDWLEGDWGTFFVITALMVIPSLVCLWLIRHKLADMISGLQVRLFSKEVDSTAGDSG
ncbi:MAG: MFS transporter [Rhodospirillales bacterium]|jgi:PAT family beta-lactamase induction signal transducer AmpG|nr:MFS transporter [Rhodospirillales bacterium]